MPRRIRLLRDSDANDLGELFLVASIVSFLGIRLFLEVTGFPQLGGRGLHIAHMLWGGLFMLLALVLLFTFIDARVRVGAAVLGGLGFGTFIDEIGKFVTADNDYFFRPAVALVYLAFIGVFFAFRAAERREREDAADALAEALFLAANAVEHGLDASGRRRALSLLDRSGRRDGLVVELRRSIEAMPAHVDDPYEILRERAEDAYGSLARLRWFQPGLVGLGLAYAAGSILAPVIFGFGIPRDSGDLTRLAVLAAVVTKDLLIVRGLTLITSSRRETFRWLRRGALVSLLVIDPFVLYWSQLAALLGITVDLLAYAALRLLEGGERSLGRSTRSAAGGPDAGSAHAGG